MSKNSLLRVASVFGIFLLTSVSFASVAGADFPSTSGDGPNFMHGECNEQYDLSGTINFGYELALSCELTVPDSDAANLSSIMVGTALYADNSWPGNPNTAFSDAIAYLTPNGSIQGSQRESGYTSCNADDSIWMGIDASNDVKYLCMGSAIAPNCTLACGPPGVVDSSWHLMARFLRHNEVIGPESSYGSYCAAGCYPVALQEWITIPPDTYSGASEPWVTPPSSLINREGVCDTLTWPGTGYGGSVGPGVGANPGSLPGFGPRSSDVSLDNVIGFVDGTTPPYRYGNQALFFDLDSSGSPLVGVSNQMYVDTITCSAASGEGPFPPYPSLTAPGGSVPGAGPCTLTDAGGDTSDTTDGTTAYPYTFTFSGDVSTIVVDTGDNVTQTIDGVTLTPTVGDRTIDGKVFAADSGVLNTTSASSPVTISVTPQSGIQLGNIGALHFWCYGDGTWYDWGDTSGSILVNPCVAESICGDNGGTPSQFAICLTASGAGISWYNPVSWVNYGWKAGICTLEQLFIPQNFQFSSLYTPITTHVPFLWISDAFDASSTLQTAITSGEASSVCAGPAIHPFTGASLSHVGSLTALHNWNITLPGPASLGCTGPGSDSAGELFGYRTLIYDVMTLLLWLGVLMIAWGMMPWGKAGQGLKALTGGKETAEEEGAAVDDVSDSGVDGG